MDYNKMVRFFEKCPSTWVPALFLVSLERCLRVDCFVDIVEVVIRSKATILKEKSEAAKQSGEAPVQQSKPKIITLTCGKCNNRFSLTDNSIHRRCGLDGCGGTLHKLG